MQFRKSPIAIAAFALFALPLAAKAQSYAGTPFSGSAVSLPASVAAVNFDKGGEGVAYHDLSSGNLGGLYRTSEGVDIYPSTDTSSGAYQVANFQSGEWMKYTVSVPASGMYDLGIRASNNNSTGAFHIEVDGVNVTGTVSVPSTGSWTTYQWFGKKGVALTAGTHVVRLVSDQQWFNVSALSMLASATTATGGTTTGGTTTGGTTTGGTTTGGTTSGGTTTGGTTTGGTATGGTTTTGGTPYTGTAASLPANVSAVNFDKGGEGVAYHDLSSGNLGGLYRTSEAVDIYASTDSASGPYQVANFQTGEWMKYTVNVAANGNYDVGIRAANNNTTGAFHIEVDGTNVTGTISVPKTGSWNTYQWFGKQGVALTAGTHVVRLVSDQQWFNVSALSVLASGTTSTGSTGGTTTGGTTTGGTTTGGTTTGTTTGSTGSTGTTTGGSTSGGTTTKPANLLFWSGFEGTTALAKPTDCYGNGCYQDVGGSDSTSGFSWPISALSGTSRFQMISNSTTYPSPDSISSWMYNELQSVVGHKGTATRALYSEVLQSGCCGTNPQGGGSTQDALHFLPGTDATDVYISKWMKFQPDLVENLKAAQSTGPWRVVFEFKEGGGSFPATGAFRAALEVVYRSDMSAPQFQVTWDTDANGGVPYQRFWRANNTTMAVPVGEWFKLEVFWHRAKDNTGRVWWAVNGQVLDDHFGSTIGVNNTPVGRIFVNQTYTGAAYPIYQWADDIQMWKGWPTAQQGDAWYDPPYAPH